MNYNIKYKNNNVIVTIDDKKNVWINNNIFRITYDNIIITVIIDNNSIIWFDINNILSIIKYDIKLIKKKYLIIYLEYDNKTKFISNNKLYKIIKKSNYNNKQELIRFLNESTIILLNNKSHLYSKDTLIKSTNILNSNKLFIEN
jgi:hypothetical protein